MNKKIITLLSLIGLLVLLSGCSKEPIKTSEVDAITITPGDFMWDMDSVTWTTKDHKEEIQSFSKSLNTLLKTETVEAHEMVGDLTLDFTLKDVIQSYQMDFDTTNEVAYLFDGTSVIKLTTTQYDELMSIVALKPYLNRSFQAPELTILYNGQVLTPNISGALSFPWFNGKKETWSPPIVEMEWAPLKVNPATDSFTFQVDGSPVSVVENLYLGDSPVSSTTLTDHQFILPSEDGQYKVELVTTYSSDLSHYEGELVYTFMITIDQPVTFSIDQNETVPGDCFVVRADNVNEGQELSVTNPFSEDKIHFYPYNDQYVAIIPIYSWTTPKAYTVTATTMDPVASSISASFDILVDNREFEVQHLIIEESALDLKTPEKLASDQKHFDEGRANPSPEKLWDGPFLQPAEGRITTEYAQIRYTNDDPTPSRHSGIDIANVEGTPVYAANNGYVTLAMELYSTGNTIMIDHGMEIFSNYYHMSELFVKVGDYVEKGDLIGKMGTTGFSTGSHLHFLVSKNNIHLDPWLFFAEDPLP